MINMFPRLVVRQGMRTSSHVFKRLKLHSAIVPNITSSRDACSASARYIPNVFVKRLYSQKETSDPVIVEYDYVKKATANNNVLIIDVREPDEIKELGKIPNSINIPLGNVTTVLGTMQKGEFEQKYKRPKPIENTEIIFYCMSGKRSGKAQQNALTLGYKNVKNYLGSWTDWATKIQ